MLQWSMGSSVEALALGFLVWRWRDEKRGEEK
jgi:hypothetical protein